MDDARPLKLVRRFHLPGKWRAWSIFWHKVDSLPCACRWPHGNCYASDCECERHRYDIR